MQLKKDMCQWCVIKLNKVHKNITTKWAAKNYVANCTEMTRKQDNWIFNTQLSRDLITKANNLISVAYNGAIHKVTNKHIIPIMRSKQCYTGTCFRTPETSFLVPTRFRNEETSLGSFPSRTQNRKPLETHGGVVSSNSRNVHEFPPILWSKTNQMEGACTLLDLL